MSELISNYYEPDTVPSREALRPSAIYEAPILFVDSKLTLLKIQYVDPEHKKPPMLQLSEVDEGSFKHPPVYEVGLRDNEEFAAFKCKRRPVVIFSQPFERWRLPGTERQAETCFCLPLFGFEGYDQEFILSIRAFKYESVFYLPAGKSFGIEESFIRFDRVQIVHHHHLKRWRPPVKLHEDALMMLQGWFHLYVTGHTEDWILQHQKVEVEKLESLLGKQQLRSDEQE